MPVVVFTHAIYWAIGVIIAQYTLP